MVTAITLPFLALITIWNWYEQNWRNHPIAKNLMYFTTAENNINRIAMDIDNEYRRYFKKKMIRKRKRKHDTFNQMINLLDK